MSLCSGLMSLVCRCQQEYAQSHKRSSRDMETETDDDLLVCSVWNAPPGSLSGSVCSSISLHSDNMVEEYIGDAPFAGK